MLWIHWSLCFNMKDLNISVFKNLYKPNEIPFIIPLWKSLERIKVGKSKDVIKYALQGKDKEEYNKRKQKLPCILFAGEFKERSKKGLIKHSGLMVIDFDGIPPEEMTPFFNKVKQNKHLITLFIIILLLNILGLIPFVKSLTSTLSITFFFSISGFLGLNIQGALIHKLYFFDKFAPNGVPFLILPGLVIIELISYFMRPISLAIRLFANMLAGHILIKLFITFCLDLSGVSIILFFGCFCFICILMSLEVFISFLQAYIFTLLILLYLNDVLNNQH
jgi:ATP synthase subunit 6